MWRGETVSICEKQAQTGSACVDAVVGYIVSKENTRGSIHVSQFKRSDVGSLMQVGSCKLERIDVGGTVQVGGGI